MGLKLYLNKFLKVDNIEQYTFPELIALTKEYERMVEESEGIDPDFPSFTFGDKKGTKIGGTNVHTIEREPEGSVYSSPKPVDDARNKTIEERALQFLRDAGLRN